MSRSLARVRNETMQTFVERALNHRLRWRDSGALEGLEEPPVEIEPPGNGLPVERVAQLSRFMGSTADGRKYLEEPRGNGHKIPKADSGEVGEIKDVFQQLRIQHGECLEGFKAVLDGVRMMLEYEHEHLREVAQASLAEAFDQGREFGAGDNEDQAAQELRESLVLDQATRISALSIHHTY